MKEIHRLEEMARLGNFDDYEVMAYEGEGTIPHFHFRNLQNGIKKQNGDILVL